MLGIKKLNFSLGCVSELGPNFSLGCVILLDISILHKCLEWKHGTGCLCLEITFIAVKLAIVN
jgi:hypothetical protein